MMLALLNTPVLALLNTPVLALLNTPVLALLDAPVLVPQLLPELLLVLTGCAVLLLGVAGPTANPKSKVQNPKSDAPGAGSQISNLKSDFSRAIPALALAAVILGCVILALRPGELGTLGGGLRLDAMAVFVRQTALILAVLILLVSWTQPAAAERGEFFAMMLFSLAGLMLTALADDLIMLFLALELVSIPSYVLVTLSRTGPRSLEAGTKYFYLGAFSAAIMAFGFSYLYGATGSASLSRGLEAAMNPGDPAFAVAAVGLLLSLGGLLFKIAAVPLHFYVADVYEGAAGPVAGFLGFVPKLAGLVAIFKLIALTGWSTGEPLYWTLWLVAAATMTVGNVLALMQTNVRRMLAYSGVAHSGYMLVGVLAGPGASLGGGDAGSAGLRDGCAAVLYYAVVYGIANLAAFAVLSVLRPHRPARPAPVGDAAYPPDESASTLRDLAGLLRRHPSLALLMSLAMFTLMGLPPTPGFWGKLSLFGAALAAAPDTPHASWTVALVIVGVVNSAIAAAYYLRVVAACLLYENDRPAAAAPRELLRCGAMGCGFLLLIFTFWPGALLSAGRAATSGLRASVVNRNPMPTDSARMQTVQRSQSAPDAFER